MAMKRYVLQSKPVGTRSEWRLLVGDGYDTLPEARMMVLRLNAYPVGQKPKHLVRAVDTRTGKTYRIASHPEKFTTYSYD